MPCLALAAQKHMQELQLSSKVLMQTIVRRALLGLPQSSQRYAELTLETNRLVISWTAHLCAALAVLAEKAKTIPAHLVTNCSTPFAVDFGPYDDSFDKIALNRLRFQQYIFIGEAAGNMLIGNRQFSIAKEYHKVCQSSYLRKVSITITLKGAVQFKLAGAEDQQWPSYTLWSKSDLKCFCDCLGSLDDIIIKGLPVSLWGKFLEMMTGQIPPIPSWAQDLTYEDELFADSMVADGFQQAILREIGHGNIRSRFMQHVPPPAKAG